MGRRHHRGGKHLEKARSLVQGAGNEENKQDFDKLGRLKFKSGYGVGKLAPVSGLSQNHHNGKRRDSHQGVNPLEIL